MRIYLAGGASANCKPMFKSFFSLCEKGETKESAIKEAMKIFLAGGESRHWVEDELLVKKTENAGFSRRKRSVESGGGGYDSPIKEFSPYILESFYYVDDDTERLLPYFGDFLLDSGAFTFMEGSHKGKIDWDDYVERYAAFIRKNNVEKFFELDIDSVVGYPSVLKLRNKLEKLAGRPSIPVWHKSRGKEDFLKMCDEYDYVAIGGIVSGEITKDEYKYFPYFISEAHKRGARIHGLGFTNLEGLKKYHWDSVDSTSWTIGNRYGKIYQFNGKTMIHHDKPNGTRLADAKATAVNNFVEWMKFQKWADTNL